MEAATKLMPYLEPSIHRDCIDDETFTLSKYLQTAGDLNRAITLLAIDFFNGGERQDYARINETLGAMEAAKLEFYRRLVAPYEDSKAAKNGDPYFSFSH